MTGTSKLAFKAVVTCRLVLLGSSAFNKDVEDEGVESASLISNSAVRAFEIYAIMCYDSLYIIDNYNACNFCDMRHFIRFFLASAFLSATDILRNDHLSFTLINFMIIRTYATRRIVGNI